jgi:hydroxypyruvate reductase
VSRRQVHGFLTDLYLAGVAAVDPQRAVARYLEDIHFPSPPTILALGKAAPAMARGVAQALGVESLRGVVVSNHEDRIPEGLRLVVGDHPIPGSGSLAAGRSLLDAAQGLDDGDTVIVLISGGGSALAEVPVAGVDIVDIARTNEVLLKCGADIEQTNAVRRHLSAIKGGGLAGALAPARLVTLVISDVVGDPLHTIASGPTVVPPEAPEARQIVAALGIRDQLPRNVLRVLDRPQPRATIPAQEIAVIANGSTAAHAAAAAAEQRGFPARVVDTRLVGDASIAAGEALQRARGSISVYAGETTVNVLGDGVGGRNQEAALTAAIIVEGQPGVFFLAAGTDGIDGATDAAGAIADGTTTTRARALGLDAGVMLDANDSGSLFAALGDQISTGPTGTNVGDLWIVMHAD